MEKIFCVECGCDEFVMKKYRRHYEGQGYDFYLDVEVPFCTKCGAEIDVEEIEDEIIDRANEKIREAREILKKDEIIEILSKYDASQKFISRMLGWGEITLTRYISAGYTPNKENSDKIKALRDPYEMLRLMCKQVDESDGKIQQEAAYIKLEKSVNRSIELIEKREGKIYSIVNWFLSKSTDRMPMTHLALQKLLYIAQGWNKALNHEWLFNNECEAWIHGAVYRDVYEKFKKYKYNPLPVVQKDIILESNERRVLEAVFEKYFKVYTAPTLETICHLETPYVETRNGVKPEERCERIISKDCIAKYYGEIADKYDITLDNMDNIGVYVRELLATA